MQEILFCKPVNAEEQREICEWMDNNLPPMYPAWHGPAAIVVPTKEDVVAFKLTFGSEMIFEVVDYGLQNIYE